MKTKRNLIQIWLLCAAMLPVVVQAQFTYTNELDYTITNGTITITGYIGTNTVVTIPDTINVAGTNLPVINIGDWAFYYCRSVTNVTIGNSVTSIGDSAFSDCWSLLAITVDANNPAYSSVGGVLFDKTQTTLLQYPAGLVGSYAIPNSVTSIGNNAFYYCNLTNIMIGTNVTSIGEGAFTEDSFTGVAIPSTVISIGDYAFSDCSSLTSVSIPNSVTSVGDYAFGYCSSLTNVTIPNSVTNMGDGAFAVCTSLTSVTIGNSVISSDEFNGCSSLTSITIPDCVTNIGDWAFWDCTDLMAITVDTRNAVYSDVDGVLFNSNLTTLIQYPGGLAGIYTVPDFVTSVGAYAFADCSKLISVTIPKGVTDIGDSAFAECLNLTSVYFVGNAPSLGSDVFDWWNSWNSGWYQEDPATIYYLPGTTGWGANYGGLPAFLCDPLSELAYTITNGTITITGYIGTNTVVTIPDTINVAGTNLPVTSIGNWFYSLSLTNVTIGNSVTSIGDSAFSDCWSLLAITVDANNPAYSSVGGVLFNQNKSTLIYYPGGLAGAYTIPNCVTSIGNSAFYYCNLTNVTIPSSVTSVGDYAFTVCSRLTSVYFQGNAPDLVSGSFNYVNNVTIYYLPGTTGWGTNYGGLPTALWLPQMQTSGTVLGTQMNQFGFNITWASGFTVVIEASTSLSNPTWSPVATNTLDENGTTYFSDPAWTNYPGRFYRLRTQ